MTRTNGRPRAAAAGLLLLAQASFGAPAQDARPQVCMMPPAAPDGRALRALFAKPEEWQETRSLIDVLGYADHMLNKQFTDDELRAWLPMIRQWGLDLELEVGAVKPWGPTGKQTFDIERKHWDRFLSLGGRIDGIGMDEPLCCVRKELKKPDEYAVEETARFIALVRSNYPGFKIREIEPYPFIPLADHMAWIEALENRLAAMQVRGLDGYRLDVTGPNSPSSTAAAGPRCASSSSSAAGAGFRSASSTGVPAIRTSRGAAWPTIRRGTSGSCSRATTTRSWRAGPTRS